MNKNEIATDIARGHELRNRIKSDTAELKLIEKRLESVALLSPHIPLQNAEREGKGDVDGEADGLLTDGGFPEE